MIPIRTCVSSEGRFVVGMHKPCFQVENLREHNYISCIGALADGCEIRNNINFPDRNINAEEADIIYEIPNAFSFRGTTYINSAWADRNADNPEKISLPARPKVNFSENLTQWLKTKGLSRKNAEDIFEIMPQPLLIALADTSSNPEELAALARMSCSFIFKKDKRTPCGLIFKKDRNNRLHPAIKNHELFEITANNKYLPDDYKKVMVLKPGVQGASEITGEWAKPLASGSSHVFEYLRKNSYIPWGHFAANTADDTIRYRIKDLCLNDMKGMRHLYYQRTFARLAEQLNIQLPCSGKMFSEDQLENLRLAVIESILRGSGEKLFFNGSLWGWNFGFGYAQSGYRLHASHQQIHQQYAMIPRNVPHSASDKFTMSDHTPAHASSGTYEHIIPARTPDYTSSSAIKEAATSSGNDNNPSGSTIPSYACGDMVAEFIEDYKQTTNKKFFTNYIKAIKSNTRTDLNPMGPSDLIIFEDENILLFVPKAQTSQWELQLMAIKEGCGNILEADSSMRESIDKGIFTALGLLESMGARMVTSMEFSKRFDSKSRGQRLFYSFMPKIPQSPGAFSEAQLRWINGHYPEDFAVACREHFKKFLKDKL